VDNGLAFISANLGAIEVLGNAANGAQYGISTVHFYWIGAVPAMLFLALVMTPYYYGSKVQSVPEYPRRRFGPRAHLFNGLSFAAAGVLIAGVNLYAWRPGPVRTSVIRPTHSATGSASSSVSDSFSHFYGAIIAFAADLVVSVAVRLVTKPKRAPSSRGWSGARRRPTSKTRVPNTGTPMCGGSQV
jgi:Na+/proline symporter